MIQDTREFKFLSGPLVKIKRMTGIAQEILSKQGDSEKKNDDLNEILTLHTVSIGSKSPISKKDIENLLISDRKKLLKELRQFTLGDPTLFVFDYIWTLSNKQKFKEKVEWNLTEMFQEKTYKRVIETIDKAGEEPITVTKLVDMDFSEYVEVIENKSFEIILRMSGRTVRLTMPDNNMQMRWQKVEQSKISSHSELMMRTPVYVDMVEGKEELSSVDLNRIDYLDIEQIRESILKMEGSIDTLITLDCEKQYGLSKAIDMVTEPTFFYPSRAI